MTPQAATRLRYISQRQAQSSYRVGANTMPGNVSLTPINSSVEGGRASLYAQSIDGIITDKTHALARIPYTRFQPMRVDFKLQ